MKTTQRILVGWIAVAISFSAGFANAGLPDGMTVALLGGAVLGQQDGGGSIFSGFSSNRPAPPNDPFLNRGTNAMPGVNGVTRLPPTTDVQQPPAARTAIQTWALAWQPGPYPGQQNGVPQGPAGAPAERVGGNRARSDAMLRSARLALAVTDVQRAGRLVAAGPPGTDSLCPQRGLAGSGRRRDRQVRPGRPTRPFHGRKPQDLRPDAHGAIRGLVAVGRVGAGRQAGCPGR